VAFKDIFFFPFGEMITSTMLLSYLNRPKLVKGVWLSAIVLSSLLISWTAILNITVFDVNVVERSVFPTLLAKGSS
jgi:spore germination protein KB